MLSSNESVGQSSSFEASSSGKLNEISATNVNDCSLDIGCSLPAAQSPSNKHKSKKSKRPSSKSGDFPGPTAQVSDANVKISVHDAEQSHVESVSKSAQPPNSRYVEDGGLFSKQGKSAADFADSVFSITIHKIDALYQKVPLFHPVVKLHIVDQVSGMYIQKSSPARNVTSPKESAIVSTILPLMTQSCALEGNVSRCPVWDEELVLNEEYLHLLKDNVIVFFEVLDFGSHWQIANKFSDGWYRACWGFLKLLNCQGQVNTEQSVQLQLFEYPANIKKNKSLLLKLFDPPPVYKPPTNYSKTAVTGRYPAAGAADGIQANMDLIMPLNANHNLIPDMPGVAVPMSPDSQIALGLKQSSYYNQLLATNYTGGAPFTSNRLHQTPFVWQLWRWMFSSSTERKMEYMRYCGRLHVTVHGHAALVPRTVPLRSMLPNETEMGRLSLSQLRGGSNGGKKSSSTVKLDKESQNLKSWENSRFPSPDTRWRRKSPYEKVELPNKTLHSIQGSQFGSLTVSFSPSGNLLAIAAIENAGKSWPIRVYSVVTGERLAELLGHQDIVYELEWNTFSPARDDAYPDQELLSISSDGTVRVWNFANPNHIYLAGVFQHPKYVYTAKWVPPPNQNTGSRYVISGGYDCKVRIWSHPQYATLSGVKGDGEASPTFAHRRRSSSVPNPAWTKETTCTKPARLLTGHDSYVNAICFERDGILPGSRFISGDGSGSIRIWSNNATPTASGSSLEDAAIDYECIKIIQTSNSIPVLHLEMHPRGRLVLVTFSNNQVMTLDHRIYRFVNEYRGVESSKDGVAMRAIWSSCGHYAIASDFKGRVWVWNAETGIKAAMYDNLPFTKLIHTISSHPKDHMLAFCGYGDNVPLVISYWDPNVAYIEENKGPEETLGGSSVGEETTAQQGEPANQDNPFSPQDLFSPLESLSKTPVSATSQKLVPEVPLTPAEASPKAARRKHRKASRRERDSSSLRSSHQYSQSIQKVTREDATESPVVNTSEHAETMTATNDAEVERTETVIKTTIKKRTSQRKSRA